MPDPAADLLAYVDRSPTPYHAVAETRRRLEAAGWRECPEADAWELAPGDRRFVVRGEGSLVAFEVGALPPAEGGFRIVGAHTDSPNLRVRPLPDRTAQGYRQVGVEPYGGVLLHTWLDRDLSLAGRVSVRDGDALRTLLLDFGRPLLRIPSLAIHLAREIKTEGLKLNPQKHLIPVLGMEDAPPLADLVASELRAQKLAHVAPADVLGYDLMTYDTQPSAAGGARGELLFASRLDNLASCHAGTSALLGAAARAPGHTRVLVLYDHEEVGSRSAQGAGGPLLAQVLERVASAVKEGGGQALARSLARSLVVSVDMAHAVHPNYADQHDPEHRPVLGGGPVLKRNAGQSYASDGTTGGFFAALCERAGAPLQHFVSRSDLACGSTIGPITAARVGVATVDVGNPMLAMHSCRETAATADVEPMIAVLKLFYDA